MSDIPGLLSFLRAGVLHSEAGLRGLIRKINREDLFPKAQAPGMGRSEKADGEAVNPRGEERCGKRAEQG